MTTPHRSSFARNLAMTLLALIIIAGTGWAIYTNQQLSIQIQSLATEAGTLKQQQTDTKTQFDSTLEQLQSKQNSLNEQLETVSKNLSKALQERWYQSNDWILLKARYYLELAEINAHWSDNTHTTSALLQQADTLLVNLHEPELFSVRQAIAKEMAEIRTIPVIDIAGLLAKLDAAQQLVTELPSKNPIPLMKTTPTVTASNQALSAWHEHLQNSIQALEKLVIIRHHDEAIKPVLTPEYEALLRETIILNLQEAQWAIIQHNRDVYKLALKQAIHTINRAFDLKATTTQTLIEQLQELQTTQLDSQKPSAGESLAILNHVIESKKITPPVAPAVNAPVTMNVSTDEHEKNKASKKPPEKVMVKQTGTGAKS